MSTGAKLALPLVALALACGAPAEHAGPQVASPPPPSAHQASRHPDLAVSPCGMNTRAVRMQARGGRYTGVEGFNSRSCPPTATVDAASGPRP